MDNRKIILSIIILFSIILVAEFQSAELFGYDNPNLPSLREELFDGKPSGFYMPNNKTVLGNFSFDGLCIDGGVEIKEGTICATRLEVYNITSVDVEKQNVTVLDNFIIKRDLILPSGTATIRQEQGVVNFMVFDTNATGSSRHDFLSGNLPSFKISHLATSIKMESSESLSIQATNEIEFRLTDATGDILINAGNKDADIIFKSSANANAGVSDGGLFGGKGAWGWGTTADTKAFFSIELPFGFESVANTDFSVLNLATNGVEIPAGTTTNVGTLTLEDPRLTATGTITNAYILKISGAPTEATNNFALWSTGGTSYFGGGIDFAQDENVMNNIGGTPTSAVVGDTQDRLVVRKQRTVAGGIRRALQVIMDIDTDEDGGNQNFGINAFVFTGESNTGSNDALTGAGGGAGGRYSFRHRGSGTYAMAGGITSQGVQIQGGTEDGNVTFAYALLDEGGDGGEGQGGIENYYSFWIMDSTGNVMNKTGIFIEDLTNANINTGILSLMSSGANQSFINHSGDAKSYFGGNISINVDGKKLFFGASDDVSFSFDGNALITNAEVGTPFANWTGFSEYNFNGNLNQTNGNLTGNMIYGSMGFHNDSVGNITALTEDIWGNFTGFDQIDSNEQILNGVAYSNSILTIQIGGVYNLDFGTSFSGTVNNKYHAAIGINGVEQLFCESHDRISTGTDILSASFPCSKRLSVGDKLMLMYMNENSGGDTTTLSARVRITRVGN